ncbi:hypothetical protein NliqN6_4958 [Naganishia liquefaciens]|uniref:Ricin B lectin domain-containing protein n=1 Tax=Naganishia liquefaciens TaxID=104408 RepID=A0A8H3YIG2_9TREE|nr:hypothetical protein NliqN6_4958 [Naganishia liquefaciens]
MLKSAIVNVFCALLLAQASSAVVIKGRTCRLLHTDRDTGATATVDCDEQPTSSLAPPVQTTSSTSCTDTTTTTSSRTYLPRVETTSSSTSWKDTSSTSYAPPVTTTSTSCTETTATTTHITSTETPVTTSCQKCAATTDAPFSSSSVAPPPSSTTTMPGGVQPPHPPKPPVESAPAPSGPYQGKFFQIIPKGQENLCLSVFSGDETLSESDGVNVQECDCDHPLYKNTWTLDETLQYTTIMSGKPQFAEETTWCLDAGSKIPANTTKPHVGMTSCIEEAGTPLAVQNWHINGNSGQISIDFEGETWCLDREFGQTNDRPVQIWACAEGNANQQWEVRYLEAAK